MNEDKYKLVDEDSSFSTPFSRYTFRTYFPKKKMPDEAVHDLWRTLLYAGFFDDDPKLQKRIMEILGEGELDPGMIDPREN